MRPTCPICDREPVDAIQMKYAMPDNWTLPTDYVWNLCRCGFIWANTPANATDFDEFYRKHYNSHVDQHDIARLHALGGFLFKSLHPTARIVDYGGGEGTLAKYLLSLGFKNVCVTNLDEEMPSCDVVVLSQVIEHLYDLRRDLHRINNNLVDGGLVVIETPEAQHYAMRTTPPMLDYYPTHVNHFTPQTLAMLAADYGWTQATSPAMYEYAPTNAPMMRMVFSKNSARVYFEAIRKKLTSIVPIGIEEPVIVYGLGDFALHQITKSGLNIAYFVDDADIYKNATINGIPIKDKLDDDDYPVLVIGSRHKAEIVSKLDGRRVITL